jgi:acetyl esterase/lipase
MDWHKAVLLLFWSFQNFSALAQESFQLIEDVEYLPTGNPRQKLDLFVRQDLKKENLPLVVWVHGGGWQHGDKKSARRDDRLPRILQTARYLGASINYRLSNQAKWPAQIQDCQEAIRWLKTNGSNYGINTHKIAVWGSSAGGHLASMLGVLSNLKTSETAPFEKGQKPSGRVQAVINYYGPSSFLRMDDYPSKIVHHSPNSPESKLLGFPIRQKQELADQASPLHHVTKNLPPFIHFHGTHDELVPYNQSVIFHQKLLSHGNSSSLITVKKGGHFIPSDYTEKYVIPFIDFHFYKRGDLPESQTRMVSR